MFQPHRLRSNTEIKTITVIGFQEGSLCTLNVLYVFVFVFIIFPLILIGYNILGYGNSQYP